jgi:putative flippase GtrA
MTIALTLVTRLLDSIFKIFKAYLPYEVYKYLAVGGICFFLNFVIFHLCYYIAYRNISWILSTAKLSVFSAYAVTLPLGFWLNSFYVFPHTTLSFAAKFFRFVSSNVLSGILTAFLIDILITTFISPIPLFYVFTVAAVQYGNFFVQKKFTFRKC